MKRILLTTDFSDNANQAIEYAMQLFKYESCSFYVLHVLKASTFVSDDLMSMKPTGNLYQELIDAAKLKLKQLIKDIEAKHNNILHSFTPLVDYDNLIEGIHQAGNLHKVDLVIMGTKGASNVAKKWFGSHTIRAIQGSELPVLAIPADCKYKPIRKVVFTTNYEHKYDQDDLKVLIDIVEHNDYQIDVLHFNSGEELSAQQEEVKSSLKDCFKNTTHTFKTLDKTDFLNSLLTYIQDNNMDLHAMVNRKYSFWERIFAEQKVETVAYNLNIPFLVM